MSGKRILLVPDRVWTDGETHRGWCVLVEGMRIAAVGERPSIGDVADCEAIELPGCTLLPGLMDLHSHLFLHPYNETSWDDQVLKETEAYRTARAVRHAQATLLAGFTTLRDLGTEGTGYADVSLKRAIEDGIVPGPRLFVAGRAIVATGSYGPARRTTVAIAAFRRARWKRAALTRSCARCGLKRRMAQTGSSSMAIIAPGRMAKRDRHFRRKN